MPTDYDNPFITTKLVDSVWSGHPRHKHKLKEFVYGLRRGSEPDSVRVRRKARHLGPRHRKRKTAFAASAALVSFNTPELSRMPSEFTTASIPIDIRQDASRMSASTDLMEAITDEEGVHLQAYRDPVGLATVGVGHLVKPRDRIKVGERITHERAMELLQHDLKHAESVVRRLVGDLPLYQHEFDQHEFDALVDLVFNVGEGSVSAENSPRLNKAILAGDYDRIANELAYEQAGSVGLHGLEYRSQRRAAIFVDGVYDNPRLEIA